MNIAKGTKKGPTHHPGRNAQSRRTLGQRQVVVRIFLLKDVLLSRPGVGRLTIDKRAPCAARHPSRRLNRSSNHDQFLTRKSGSDIRHEKRGQNASGRTTVSCTAAGARESGERSLLSDCMSTLVVWSWFVYIYKKLVSREEIFFLSRSRSGYFPRLLVRLLVRRSFSVGCRVSNSLVHV